MLRTHKNTELLLTVFIVFFREGRFKIHMSIYVKSKKSNYEYKNYKAEQGSVLTPKLDT